MSGMTGVWGWVGLGAVLVVLWRSRTRDLRRSLPPGDDDATLVSLARDGQRLEAVRRYRSRAGCGLKEAKEAVDALVAGRAPETAPPPPGPPSARVEALVREGRLLEAIKAHREAHPGLGLAEAKAAVDELARRLGR